MPVLPDPRATVIVAVADHVRRRAWSAALSAAGFAPRPVSRTAEMAKALADGGARLVVAVAGADDGLLTGAARIPVQRLAADVAMSTLVGEVHHALHGAGVRSTTTHHHP